MTWEGEGKKRSPYTVGENVIWIKIIYFTELSEGGKEENNISTSTLEDYNLFSRLSDNLYSSNTNNAASDKVEGGGALRRHREHGSRHLRLGRVAITCGDKYIIPTEGEIGLDEKEASEMTQTFTTRLYSHWEKNGYFILLLYNHCSIRVQSDVKFAGG